MGILTVQAFNFTIALSVNENFLTSISAGLIIALFAGISPWKLFLTFNF